MAGRTQTEVEAPQEQAAPAPEKDEASLRREAYTAATRRLRDQYRDEFVALVKEEASNRGVTYEPRKSPEERAQEQIQKILSEHPGLRDRI